MPSLVPTGDAESFRQSLRDHFDTFKRNVTINKEPQKVVTMVNSNVYAGYGMTSQEEEITYIPVSGIYPALIKYKDAQELQPFFETRHAFSKGDVRIKLEESGHSYIQNGRTENVIVDGGVYNLNSDFAVQNYLGQLYYIYHLSRTQ